MQMCRVLALALALICALPAPLCAGAWLRGVGDGFLSWGVKVQDHDDTKTYSTVYAEYGINPDLTLGVDLGSDEAGGHKALAFVRMPLSRERLHVAFELGAGVLGERPAIRPGLSLGQGLTFGERNGWFNIDTRANVAGEHVSVAIDTTIGLHVGADTMLIGQLQQGGPMGDPDFLRLTGSVVWRISPHRQLEVGMSRGLINAEDFGIELGLWREF